MRARVRWVAVLAVVTMAAGCTGGGEDEAGPFTTASATSTTATTSTTGAATTTTVPSTTTLPAGWIRLDPGPDFPSPEHGGGMKQVVPFGDGFVGIGGDDLSAAVYMSPDGRTWTQRYPVAGYLPWPAHGLDASETGVVVWGGNSDQGHLLTSPDGEEWFESTLIVFSPGIRSARVLGEGRGFLVASGAAIDWSQDGREWERVVRTPLTSDRCRFGELIEAETYLLALATCPSATSVWRSEDGRRWDGPAELPEQEVCSTASFGDTVVTMCGSQVMVTGDGAAWDTMDLAGYVPAGTATGDGGANLRDPTTHWEVAATESGFVAAVTRSDSSDVNMVTSNDGRTWTLVETLEAPRLPTGLEAMDGVCSVLAYPRPGWCDTASVDGWDDRFWLDRFEVVDGSVFLLGWSRGLLSGCPGGSVFATVAWMSPDNVTWELVPIYGAVGPSGNWCGDAPLSGDRVAEIVASGDEYVFLGSGVWVWTPPGT